MGTITKIIPNVAYNFQKVPNLVTSNLPQSLAGLAITLRDQTQLNRNVNFLFPVPATTPNFGAGSPTLLGRSSVQTAGDVEYAGVQLPI